MAMGNSRESYKKQLIERVKAMGQEVIERAEDLVGDGELLGDFTITIRFEEGSATRPAELEITRLYYSHKDIDILTGGVVNASRNN